MKRWTLALVVFGLLAVPAVFVARNFRERHRQTNRFTASVRAMTMTPELAEPQSAYAKAVALRLRLDAIRNTPNQALVNRPLAYAKAALFDVTSDAMECFTMEVSPDRTLGAAEQAIKAVLQNHSYTRTIAVEVKIKLVEGPPIVTTIILATEEKFAISLWNTHRNVLEVEILSAALTSASATFSNAQANNRKLSRGE